MIANNKYNQMFWFVIIYLLFVNIIFAEIKIESYTQHGNSGEKDSYIEVNGNGFNDKTRIVLWPVIDSKDSFIGLVDTPGYAVDISFDGNKAYIADFFQGIQIVDISNPEHPKIIGGYKACITDRISVRQEKAFVNASNGLTIIDFSDNFNPVLIQNNILPTIYDILIGEDEVYLAAGGVIKLKYISNSWKLNDYIVTPGMARGICLSNDIIYLAVGDSGLQIVTKSFTKKGHIDTPGFAESVSISNNYAYIADGNSGMQIIDISDLNDPKQKGFIETPGYARELDLYDNIAYIADINNVQIIDVQNPEKPVFITLLPVPDYVLDVKVHEGYLYISNYSEGVLIIPTLKRIKPTINNNTNLLFPTQEPDHFGNYAFIIYNDDSLAKIEVPFKPPYNISDIPDQNIESNIEQSIIPFTITPTYSEISKMGYSITVSSSNKALIDDSNIHMELNDKECFLKIIHDKNMTGISQIDINLCNNISCLTKSFVCNISLPELKIETISPKTGVIGNDSEVIIKGKGFSENTRVFIMPDDYNRTLASIDIEGKIKNIELFENKIFLLTEKEKHIANEEYLKVPFPYSTGINGLQIIDISDISNPIIKGIYVTKGDANSVVVQGNIAYIAEGYNGLSIIDVSNVIKPKFIKSIDLGGYVNDIKLNGKRAFISNETEGLQIIDIENENETDPELIKNINCLGFIHDFKIINNIAYLATSRGLEIINIDNYQLMMGNFNVSYGSVNGIDIMDDIAYLTVNIQDNIDKDEDNNNENGILFVIDVKNPEKPVKKIKIDINERINGVTCIDDLIYVHGNEYIHIIKIYDSLYYEVVEKKFISDPYDSIAENIIIENNLAFVSYVNSNHLNIFNMLKFSNNQLYNTEKLSLLYGIKTVYEDILYIINNDEIIIMDVNDPKHPLTKGITDIESSEQGFVNYIIVFNKKIFMTNELGLLIYDISDPLNPIFDSYIETPGCASDVAISKEYAYVADGESGLQIINISDTSSLTIINNYDDEIGDANSIDIINNLAYIADRENGIQVINIDNPKCPHLEDKIELNGGAIDVKIIDNIVCVKSRYTLMFYDISTQVPNYLYSYPNFGEYILENNILYLFDSSNNHMMVIDIKYPKTPRILEKIVYNNNMVLWHLFSGIPNCFIIAEMINFNKYEIDDILETIIFHIPQEIIPIIESDTSLRLTLPSSKLPETYNIKIIDNNQSDNTYFTFKDPFVITGIQDQIVVNYNEKISIPIRITSTYQSTENHIDIVSYSSNPELIPENNIKIIGNGYDRTLEIEPVKNKTGKVLINMTFNDGKYSMSRSFNLIVKELDIKIESFTADSNFIGNTVCAKFKGKGFNESTKILINRNINSSSILNVSKIPLNAKGLTVKDDIIYIADGEYGLKILKKNDNNIELITNFSLNGTANKVVLNKDVLYIANDEKGMIIINVEDPENPTVISQIDTPGTAIDIKVVSDFRSLSDYAFIADGNSGLQIFDVTNIEKPSLAGSIDTDYAKMVAVNEDTAYVADFLSGIKLIDISNIDNPEIISYMEENIAGVALAENKLFITGDYFKIFNISNSNNLEEISQLISIPAYKDPNIPNTTFDFTIGIWGLPISPQKSSYLDFSSSYEISVLDDFAYVTNGNNLFKIDIKNPSNAAILSTFNTEFAYDVCIIDDKAYVASGNQGLKIIDINSISESNMLLDIDSKHIKVNDNYVYISCGGEGFYVINTLVPSNPSLSTNVVTSGSVTDIEIKDNKAYVACGSEGLKTYNVQNPFNIDLIESFEIPAIDIDIHENIVCVACGDKGLQIFKLNGLSIIDSFNIPIPCYADSVDILGDFAYITGESNSNEGYLLQIINVKTKEIVSHIPLSYFQNASVKVIENIAYLTYTKDCKTILKIVDIENPNDPILKGECIIYDSSSNIEFINNMAYIVTDSDNLNIIDLKDSNNPIIIKTVKMPFEVKSISIKDGLLYIAGNSFDIIPLPIILTPLINDDGDLTFDIPSLKFPGPYVIQAFNKDSSDEIIKAFQSPITMDNINDLKVTSSFNSVSIPLNITVKDNEAISFDDLDIVYYSTNQDFVSDQNINIEKSGNNFMLKVELPEHNYGYSNINLSIYNNGALFTSESFNLIRKFPQILYQYSGILESEHFQRPNGIAGDKNNNIYISDINANKILKFNNEDEFEKYFECSDNDEVLCIPYALAIDNNDNLYVLDINNNKIIKMKDNEYIYYEWVKKLSENGNFSQLKAIAIDNTNSIYIINNNNVIKSNIKAEIDTDWNIETPYIIVSDENSFVYVVETDKNLIKKYSSTEFYKPVSIDESFLTQGIATHPNFQSLTIQYQSIDESVLTQGIATDNNGFLYISDTDRILKYSSSGECLLKWGNNGKDLGNFVNPIGVAIDEQGLIYIADNGNHRVQVFTPYGELITFFGGYGEYLSFFKNPTNLYIDKSNDHNIYVVDQGNKRIQKFKKFDYTDGITKAIIIAGCRKENDYLWDNVKQSAVFAYSTLIHQGFKTENIKLLSGNTNINSSYINSEKATLQSIGEAITKWTENADSLVLYLVDHGEEDIFHIKADEILKASTLNNWLNKAQEKIAGKVIVIYDACKSGSFLDDLSEIVENRTRIVITSTNSDENSNFTYNALSFSSFFWSQISLGSDLMQVFKSTRDIIKQLYNEKQNPQFKIIFSYGDNSNYNESDLKRLEKVIIGNGIGNYRDKPYIGKISAEQSDDYESIEIMASNIWSINGIKEVWADITHKSLLDQTIKNLPSINLKKINDNLYSGVYNLFNHEGTYEIFVFAKDNNGVISDTKKEIVTIDDTKKNRAIFIAGQIIPDNPNFENCLIKKANKALISQGYHTDNIRLFSKNKYFVNKNPISQCSDISECFEWVDNQTNNLVVYLMSGEGNSNTFVVNTGEIINAEKLQDDLDIIQENISGFITVLYEAPNSDRFVQKLTTDKKRILIASSSNNESITLENAILSFSSFFWNLIFSGHSIAESFYNLYGIYKYFNDFTAQKPSIYWGKSIDPWWPNFKNYRIGYGCLPGGDLPPYIISVSPGQELHGNTSAEIYAEISKGNTIDKVFAIISKPLSSKENTISPDDCRTINTIELNKELETNIYKGTWNKFQETGIYNIHIFAIDSDDNISIPSTKSRTWVNQYNDFVKGDINLDGKLNILDLIIGLKILSEMETNNFLYFDINKDNKLGLEEVLFTLLKLSDF